MSKKYFFANPQDVNGKRQCFFIPDEDIDCNPPYRKGVNDSCWAYVKGVKPTNKEASERAIGIKLQEYK